MNYENCPHERSVIRRWLDAGNRAHFKTQCLDCGHYGKNGAFALSREFVIGRGIDPAAIPPFDNEAFAKAEADRQTEYQVEYLRGLDERRTEREAHYKSDKWRDIRSKVIARAGGVCEGCGVAKATQAHHWTYENFGDEFLWELYAVCEPCHERVHAEHKATEAEDRAALGIVEGNPYD